MINKMNKKKLTEKILNHALGIIYLLTGEEYVVMKKNSPHSTTSLLTGEVPIKCGDISIYFSTEEWDYIEQHKDHYKDVMVKSHQSISAVRVPSNLSSDLQEDDLDCLSGAEDAGNTEVVEPPEPPTAIIIGEAGDNIQSVEQVEETLKESMKEEEIIDVTGEEDLPSSTPYHSLDRGTVEESHQAAWLEGETVQTSYVSQEFQREDVTNNFSNDPYDVVNLISNSVSDEHKPFSLGESFLPENNPSWENVHIVRRKSRKQDLKFKTDYLDYEAINEDQLEDLENDCYIALDQESSTPYICCECGRCFVSEPTLAEHMKKHSVEKPHRCSDCGREFEYRSRLIVHQRTHNGGKPHKCEDCGKDFNYRSRLLVHQRKHTGVKPHKCNLCGKQFDYKSHLNRHQRTHT
ncbi:zinc finger protein 554-like [Hyla sarda]|uniref:zinc finger protein 554-like n=1 Tax=Hyla sarda TaxID=327740 RepID=UPI0024C40E15|nr:zinc finger protein 554-like [Hyla sarda]XP_056394083.1 zinc finger protein 554-like [Hyla sarda]XP_056394084.1 zinc finger protein 554-like [Hyla sarda]XP_056394085.1 zinc finger protein 554-like [Hyla sarda]XP_056394086.1 zinc finger protein 554-like [Hyla sarda]XP_056394088.1 zinc finger protein 554-like [Hyla sarda]